MSNNKMHEHEIDIDETLVKKLLSAQFPQWAKLPIERVKSDGTVHAIYRLGVDMCVRLPRIAEVDHQMEIEQKWLPFLAPHLPLAIPAPLGKGNPEGSYPWHWSIYRWLEGSNAVIEPIADLRQAAIDLAQFINALHKIDPTGGPISWRGNPLSTQNIEVLDAIKALDGIIDTQAAIKVWESCLQAPVWDKPPVWIHSDLLPANLLTNRGRITAVIDFGMLGIGDPACDLIPAWGLFSADDREIFRATLEVDDATWIRGRGWALSIGLIILPYYLNTNPGLVAVGKRLITEVFADFNY